MAKIILLENERRKRNKTNSQKNSENHNCFSKKVCEWAGEVEQNYHYNPLKLLIQFTQCNPVLLFYHCADDYMFVVETLAQTYPEFKQNSDIACEAVMQYAEFLGRSLMLSTNNLALADDIQEWVKEMNREYGIDLICACANWIRWYKTMFGQTFQLKADSSGPQGSGLMFELDMNPNPYMINEVLVLIPDDMDYIKHNDGKLFMLLTACFVEVANLNTPNFEM